MLRNVLCWKCVIAFMYATTLFMGMEPGLYDHVLAALSSQVSIEVISSEHRGHLK